MNARWSLPLAAALALAAACAARPSHAIVVARPPEEVLRRLAASPDTIVVARVVSSTGVAFPDSGAFSHRGVFIRTRHRVVVTEVWKGQVGAGDSLDVWTPGGSVPGHGGTWIEDSAELSAGRTFVLFLTTWRGLLSVDGGEMGALEVTHGRVNGYLTNGERKLGWLRDRVRP